MVIEKTEIGLHGKPPRGVRIAGKKFLQRGEIVGFAASLECGESVEEKEVVVRGGRSRRHQRFRQFVQSEDFLRGDWRGTGTLSKHTRGRDMEQNHDKDTDDRTIDSHSASRVDLPFFDQTVIDVDDKVQLIFNPTEGLSRSGPRRLLLKLRWWHFCHDLGLGTDGGSPVSGLPPFPSVISAAPS